MSNNQADNQDASMTTIPCTLAGANAAPVRLCSHLAAIDPDRHFIPYDR
jgi:hypothetical protein